MGLLFLAAAAWGQEIQESEPARSWPAPESATQVAASSADAPIEVDPEIEADLKWRPTLDPEGGLRLWDCLILALENNRPLRNARDSLRIAQVTLRERVEEFGNLYFLGAGLHYDETLRDTLFDRYSVSFGGAEGGISGAPDGAIVTRRFTTGGGISIAGRSTYQSSEEPRLTRFFDNQGNPFTLETFNDIRWFSEANVAITKPLLEGAGEVATTDLRVQQLERAAVNLDLERFIQSVVNDVIRNYLAVQRAFSLALVQRDSYSRAIQVYQRTREFFELTRRDDPNTSVEIAALNLYRSEQQVTSTQQQYIDARNNIDTALINLRLTLGIEPDTAIVLSSTGVPTVPPPTMAIEEAIQEALKQRPDLRATEIGKMQQDLGLYQAKNSLLPNLDFDARIGFREEKDDFLESWKLFSYEDVSANLRMNLPLNLPSDKANFERSQILVRQSQTDVEQRRRVITNEVDEAYRTQKTLLARISILRRNEELARKAFEIITGQAEFGIIDPFDSVQAQNDLTAAESQRVRAEIDYVIAMAALHFSLGRPISELLQRFSPSNAPPSGP
ncbi:MAG: hypothetical protein GHCLOJNM_00870 [bacterium]|nr:hypothetical protein [bacterium]